MVRGISHDADTNHSYHSNKQNSVHTKPPKLAFDSDYCNYNVGRNVSAVLSVCRSAWFCKSAAALLAAASAYAELLYHSYSDHQSMAVEESVDIIFFLEVMDDSLIRIN